MTRVTLNMKSIFSDRLYAVHKPNYDPSYAIISYNAYKPRRIEYDNAYIVLNAREHWTWRYERRNKRFTARNLKIYNLHKFCMELQDPSSKTAMAVNLEHDRLSW